MNYMGSKSRIAKNLVPIIQKYIDDNNIHTYIEPFVGGANVIDKIVCERKIGSDLNKYVIQLFNYIQNGGSLKEEYTKDVYDKARKAWREQNKNNKFEEWELGCIGWLCSYCGRGFDGGWSYKGTEKRKDGTVKERFFYQERKANLLKQSEQPLFKDIEFHYCDYSVYQNISNCVIYCDIPYYGTKQYDLSKNFDYDKFWNFARELSKKNIVLISELQAPSDFSAIWEQSVSRSLNKNKTYASEKLFIKK